jgi:D-3-phosphoglycerate dehydrogenase
VSKYHVAILDNRFKDYRDEEAVLKQVDAAVAAYNPQSEAETAEAIHDADGVLVNLHELSSGIIEKLTRCRIISRYGVGYDNVDVQAATAKGIWVANVPDYAMEDVSDHALALLLACIRKIPYRDKRIREGGWNLGAEQVSFRIKGKILGLVGYGGIARALHRKASALGLEAVLVFDPYLPAEKIRECGADPVDLNELLSRSDFISLHAPLSEETKGMIGEEELALMKETSILINTARGPIVEEKALCKALAEGCIQAAGLDVFEVEPLPPESSLMSLDNVVLTDHTGYYSEESLVELKTKAALNAAKVLQGGEPVYPVNRLSPGIGGAPE